MSAERIMWKFLGKSAYCETDPSEFFLMMPFFLPLALLGRCCCEGSFLVGESGGCSVAVLMSFLLHWPVVQSPGSRRASFGSQGSWAPGSRLRSHGAWAQLPCGVWDLPGSGIEPASSASAGAFFTTEPPGKPSVIAFKWGDCVLRVLSVCVPQVIT